MSGAETEAASGFDADPLVHLLGRKAAETFFRQVYEREPLVVRHDDPARFSSLLSIEAIDRFIAGADLRGDMLSLADASRALHRDDYVNAGNIVVRGDVVRQHQLGATVILQQHHNSDPGLARLCRGIEAVFSCHVQTNIYLTPPASQGFPIHYDSHDVFVLQVAGEKLWRLYDSPVDTPYRGEGFRAQKHRPGETSREFVLKAGDCAYIPRGLMHDAETTGDETSLHVTVGLIVKTWADLMLEAVSALALEEPAFRRSLPPGYARADFDREKARAHFRELAGKIGESVRMDAAMDLIGDEFIRSRDADVAGGLLEAARPITPDNRFRARPFAPWRLADDGEDLVLILAGGELRFAPQDRAGLERALSGAPFGVTDLVCEDGAEMIRRLRSAGQVERI